MRYFCMLAIVLMAATSCKKKTEPTPSSNYTSFIGGINTGRNIDMEITSDGGSVILATTSAEPSDLVVVKINALGEVQWKKTYGAALTDYSGGIAVKANGGYFISGTRSFSVDEPDDSTEVYVASLDAQGNVIWDNHYPCSTTMELNIQQGPKTTDIGIKPNGGFFIFGAVDSAKSDQDVFVMSFEENGERSTEIDLIFGTRDKKDVPSSLIVLSNERAVLSESSALDGKETVRLVFVVENSDYLLTESANTMLVPENLTTSGLIKTGQGYAMIGNTLNLSGDSKDIYFEKWGSDSYPESPQYFGNAGSEEKSEDLISTDDGGYLVLGTTNNTELIGAQDHLRDVYLLKLNSAEDVEWERTLGNSLNDIAWSVKEVSDGYVICSTAGVDQLNAISIMKVRK